MKNFFDKEPDFVNEEGTKWWVDRSTTKFAQQPDINNVRLPNVVCFATEQSNGYRSYVITENQQIEYAATGLEAIGVHIDIMKLSRRKE